MGGFVFVLRIPGPWTAFLALDICTFLYKLGGLYRLKSCGGSPFEDIAIIVRLVLGHCTRSRMGCPRGGRTGKWVNLVEQYIKKKTSS